MQRLLATLLLAVPALAAPTGSVTDATTTTTPAPPTASSAAGPDATAAPDPSWSSPSHVCSGTQFTGWNVTGLEYHASYIFTTPAHQNSWGYVNFNLTHPGLDLTAACSASSNQLSDFFYGSVPYTCTLPDGAKGEVSFTFSRPSGELAVTQSWSCPSENPQFPGERWTAKGNTTVDLSCTDETYTNPNWTTPGTIYSDREVKCTPVDLFLDLTEIQGVA